VSDTPDRTVEAIESRLADDNPVDVPGPLPGEADDPFVDEPADDRTVAAEAGPDAADVELNPEAPA
jgi:hypothetical protein